MIVVRAAARPGGWDLLADTLAGVDREGGLGQPRLLIADNEEPPPPPSGWRLAVHRGDRGARASLWAALAAVCDYPRPVLFLEDDLSFAPGAVTTMLGADFGGCPLVSFFYPRYAQAHELLKKQRPKPASEVWLLAHFGWSQAFLLDHRALARVVEAGYFPAPPKGGPHGGDYALKDALRALGYSHHRVLWPNPVEHTGVGGRAAIEGHRRFAMRSGWHEGRAPIGYRGSF